MLQPAELTYLWVGPTMSDDDDDDDEGEDNEGGEHTYIKHEDNHDAKYGT